MARPYVFNSQSTQPKTLRQRVKSALLGGEKGAGLPGFGEVVVKGRRVRVGGRKNNVRGKVVGKDGKEQKENPVARLKLLLITSFLILHILNFITPLTPSKHNHSSSSSALHSTVNIRKVDITASGLRAVLTALVEAEGDMEINVLGDERDQGKDLFVKVSPPVYIRVVLPSSMLGVSPVSNSKPSFSKHISSIFSSGFITHGISSSSGAHSASTTKPKSSSSSASEFLESFMSAWTRLVGDPILSKWIVIMLALSVALNGYLLKGIAAGLVGGSGMGSTGMMKMPFGLKGGVRFEGVGGEGESEAEEEEGVKVVEERRFGTESVVQVKVPENKRETAPVPATAPAPATGNAVPDSPTALAGLPAIGTFSLEDVDRKLKAAAVASTPASRRLTITPATIAAAKKTSTITNGNPTPPSSSSDASSSELDAGSMEVENIRSLEECMDIFDNGPRPLSESLSLLNDEEVILLAQNGKIAAYALEKVLGMGELERAVRIRRALISRASRTQTLESSDIPLTNYDYSRVLGACCENVIGYIPLPLGIAGPLNVDGALYPIPMATAEGTLVASTSRGCKALNAGGGVTTVLTQDAMTRGPAIDFPSVAMAADAKMWIDSEDGYATIKEAFESTSRFARLKSLKTGMAGRTLFVRFATGTGDAMGMNMISKGTEKALETMQKHYPEMVVLALSGNYCTDKKPAAINWIEGRGKSVVAEAVVPGKVVKSVLKTTVASLVNLNTKKNLVGSAMAGSIGGFNAHAANILTAMFLATGQDPAQNVESSMCMTLMEPINDGEDLLMTVSMPCIEVGTVGGGTVLGPQQSVLEMLGMKGAHPTHPGQNAQGLARLIAAAVMAGELSLLSALAAGHLIRAHMAHNRSQTNTPAPSVPPTPGLGGGMVLKAPAQLPPAPAPTPADGAEGGSERERVRAPLVPLTPSSSTGSLPPYSQ